jgi:hypothetical protein
MGGFGSGRPSGLGQGKVDAYRWLDVNRLHKAGCLRFGWSGEWKRDGERVARIAMRAEENRLVLSCRHNGEEWQKSMSPCPSSRCRAGSAAVVRTICPGL